MFAIEIVGDAIRFREKRAMRDVREMVLRDVRCFEGVQRGNVRPITLLVGENSTGKSTFLGCYSVLHRVLSEMDFVGRPDFNEEPFFLGSFRDIVRSRRGPSGRINQFQLGFVTTPVRRSSQVPCRLLATFAEQGSQPVVSSFRWQFDTESFLEARRGAEGETILRIPDHEVETEIPFMNAMFLFDVLGEGELLLRRWGTGTKPIVDYLEGLLANQGESSKARSTRGLELWPHLPDLIPVAPLRSKPKRTYDPIRETASPDGEHIPMLMMRLDHTAKSHWDALHDNLVEFGRQSGLFSDIKVKRHGKQMSDPFQLQVKVRSGSHANIMDVGYGVSQSLPILVDVMAADELGRRSGTFRRRRGGRAFLLQQPEVHLHPRGQAELASLFVESFKRRGNHFLIETHSDYIIDRVRISVRKGTLKPDEVSIIYFEPKGNAVKIHNMTLDKEGNLKGAPEEYRDFFARETDQLLGFSE